MKEAICHLGAFVAAMMSFSVTAQAVVWDQTYEGNVIPSDSAPTWTHDKEDGLSEILTGETLRMTDPESWAINNDPFMMGTSPSTFLYNDPDVAGVSFVPATGIAFTVEWRMKVNFVNPGTTPGGAQAGVKLEYIGFLGNLRVRQDWYYDVDSHRLVNRNWAWGAHEGRTGPEGSESAIFNDGFENINLGEWHVYRATSAVIDGTKYHRELFIDGTYIGRWSTELTNATAGSELKMRANNDISPDSDIEFDYVRWSNEPEGLYLRPQPAATCTAAVIPTPDQTVFAYVDEPANPLNLRYTVGNPTAAPLGYTVTELDEAQAPTDVPWLITDKTAGTVAPLENDMVTVTFDTSGDGGVRTAYLLFTDACDPASTFLRKVVLIVSTCSWTLDGCDASRAYVPEYPDAPINDIVYTITNTRNHSVTYGVQVQYTGCQDWLTLTNASDSTPVAGQSQVIASVNKTAAAACVPGVSTALLTFIDGCSTQISHREITLRIVETGKAKVWEYVGDVAPDAPDSAGVGLNFAVIDGIASGSVEQDNQAENTRVWHIVDPAGQKTKYATRSAGVPAEVYDEAGFTIVSRFKVSAFTGGREGGLFVFDTQALGITLHWSGSEGLLRETRRGISVTLPGTSDFVTFRITAIGAAGEGYDCERMVRVYVNEGATPVMEILTAAGSSTDINDVEGFGFGAGSTSGTMDIAFDWFTATNAGAFAPRQEEQTLGRTLLPSFCNRPFADADADQDVDMDDFGVFQACLTGHNVTASIECKCFDRAELPDMTRDGDIDEQDFAAFKACVTGPAVIWEAQLTPECNP